MTHFSSAAPSPPCRVWLIINFTVYLLPPPLHASDDSDYFSNHSASVFPASAILLGRFGQNYFNMGAEGSDPITDCEMTVKGLVTKYIEREGGGSERERERKVVAQI